MKKSVFKKLLILFTVVFMFANPFVKHNNIEAEPSEFTTAAIDGEYLKNNGLVIHLNNHDDTTFNSLKVDMLDEEGNPLGVSYEYEGTLTDATQETYVQKAEFDAYNFNYKFTLDSRVGFTFNEGHRYKFKITVDGGSLLNETYRSKFFEYEFENACLQRMQVTKIWNDNYDASDKRPTAEEYAEMILLDGNEPNEVVIKEDGDERYVYIVYGNFNARNPIEISEKNVEGYICTEANGSWGIAVDDQYNYSTGNISKASIKNKLLRDFYLKLIKVDDEGTLLQGVEFTITNIGETTVTIDGTEVAPNGTYVVESDEDGLVYVEKISPLGKYKIEETKTLDGYAITFEPKEFTFADAEEEPDLGIDLLDLGEVVNKPAKFLIKKVWNDADNADEIRPESITVLLKDKAGVEDDLSFVLPDPETGKWELSLTSADGLKPDVEYYVEEDFVEGYESSIEQTTEDDLTTITITNKHTPTTTALALKLWDDDHDKYGNRPTPEEIKENIVLYTRKQISPYMEKVGNLKELEEMGINVNFVTENVEQWIIDNNFIKPDKQPMLYGKDAYLIVIEGLEKYYLNPVFNMYMKYEFIIEEEGDIDNYLRKRFTRLSDYNYSAYRIDNSTAQGDLIIEATKQLDGRKLEEDEFEFILRDEEGKEVGRARNDADGNITFEGISFEVNDLDKISYYEASEEQKNNIKYWLITEIFVETDANEQPRSVARTENIPGNAYNRSLMKYFSETTLEERKEKIESSEYSISACLWTDNENGYVYWELEGLEYIFENRQDEYDAFVESFDFFARAKELNFTIEEVPGNEADVTYDTHKANVKAYVYFDGTTELATNVLIEDEDNVFTNKFRTNINVEKKWDDDDNEYDLRPESIVIKLLANGKETGDTLILSEDNKWKGTFEDLPKYDGEKEITYTVKEETVDGYEDPVITGSEQKGFTVTNKVLKTNVKVEKIWDDNDDEYELRPTSIKVSLLADGKLTGDTLVLNKANNWKGTFEDLPKYIKDKEVIYTVKEETVDGYEDPVITGDMKNGFIITNTVTPGGGKKKPIKPDIPYTIPKTGVE